MLTLVNLLSEGLPIAEISTHSVPPHSAPAQSPLQFGHMSCHVLSWFLRPCRLEVCIKNVPVADVFSGTHTHTHTHALRSKKQTNKQISCRCTHLSCIWHLTLERPSRVPLMRHWKRQREREWETEWDWEWVRGERRRCVRASSVQYAYRFHNNNYGLLLLGKCISHLLFPSYYPPFTSPCTLLKFAFLFWDNSPCVDFWFVILCIRFHLSGQSNYYAWHSALPSLLGFPFPLSSFLLFYGTPLLICCGHVFLRRVGNVKNLSSVN